MKITIEKQDWSPGTEYTNPCNCLLSHALRRETGKRWSVGPGTADEKLPAGMSYGVTPQFTYDCDEDRNGQRLEELLMDAHDKPSLLPITIELIERT